MSKVDPRLIEGAASSVEGLLRLLIDGLDWPIPQDGELLNDADLLLDWDPVELHLDPQELGTLTAIQQVPRLTTEQPFGVFVLTFEGGRLPIGALRRLVRQLVRRRRRTHVESPTWELGDLLFFCHSDDGRGNVNIVAFRNDGEGDDLRVINWSDNPTPTRRALLSEHTLPDLMWPEPGVTIEQWRHQWRSAFTAGYRQGVKTAKELSQRMAEVAADIRDEITDLLTVETDDGPLHQMLADMRKRLDASIDEAKFGDVFAQTLVYGLLSSRISHPDRFHATQGHALLDFENPFLDAVYATFRAHADDSLDLDHLGLTDLAHTLAATDTDALLADFGAADRRDDPVIYLYEEFLDRYDRAQRAKLGAYYTPIPLVDTIIRLTHHALRTTAGIEGGIADTRTWAQYAAEQGIAVPADIEPSSPVVSMLDPATGTGTFLLQWLRAVEALDSSNTEAHLAAMTAIEISLASYAIAHLKTSLELPEEIRESTRPPIYLGDTLAGPRPFHLTGLEDPIARETEAAQAVKDERPASVIVGNPPYDRITRDEGGGWILHPEPGQPDLFSEILDPAVEHTIFSYTTNLYNLYVYFWRWAIWKAFEQHPDMPATVTLGTASSWLDGPGFLGLRRLARQVADEVFVIDLGGDNKGGVKDESVFGIETPVAIVCLARRGRSDRATPARVLFRSVAGTRAEKLEQLEALDPTDGQWTEVDGTWFGPLRPSFGGVDWTRHPLLTDLIPWQQPGCMYNRTWPIAPHPDLLAQRWARLMSTDDPADRAACFVPGASGRGLNTTVAAYPRLIDEPVGAAPQPTTEYGYRSFDRQWTLDDPRLAKTDSPSLWASRSADQLFLVVTTTQALTSGPAASIFTGVPDKHAYNGRGGKDVFPLYRDASGTPNVDSNLIRALSAAHGEAQSRAEDLFAYCYAILAGTDYTERFATELQSPGPRVPLTADAQLFAEIAAHGRALIHLHTNGTRFQESPPPFNAPAVAWRNEPTRPPATIRECIHDSEHEELTVADGVLTGVPAEVWGFNVSGMPVLRKWLGYRTAKGAGRAARSSSPLDNIRPTMWYPEWSDELAELVTTLRITIQLMERGALLLERVLEGDVIAGDQLPQPPKALRDVPKAARRTVDGQGTLI